MARPTFYATRMIHLPACRVQVKHVDKIKALADSLGCSVSDLIRLAVEDLIQHSDQIVIEDE